MITEPRSIGSEAAIAMAATKWWESLPPKEIARIGMSIRELCLPFTVLHRAVETALGRPVYSHEFGSLRLTNELFGLVAAPTLEEILAMIPSDKQVIVVALEPS